MCIFLSLFCMYMCILCFFLLFWVSFVAFSFSTLILLVGGFWPVKTVSHITYTVLVGTLNHAQPNPILLGPPKTVSWYPASSQEKTSWTGMSWGGDEMWPMILLCHVFREVILCLRAGDRKSSATNSRQSAGRHYQGSGANRTQRPATG